MAQGYKTGALAALKSTIQTARAWVEARSLPTLHAIDPMIGWGGCVDTLALAHTRYVAIPVVVTKR
ncbi:hypothetical protein BVG79_00896 [Ketogulonicigenium robustum]|uniref:Uncharacterized protein n=1 Tax=Ketogulonicigenium robustum TaxID=92947 RepID=A0A1W6NYC5_9RHOB|nr:hypothetical protein [Ketogulonicigenium robustum]ARO14248.1 hypothetical protein BVG79_00896 [Ketogulonicigenium robustum]